MPKVIYEQTLIRSIEVEVSDEQLAALKDSNFSLPANQERWDAHLAARQYVVDTALEVPEQDAPLEFASAICVDEHDEELFDL